jgi:hypothetical protein
MQATAQAFEEVIRPPSARNPAQVKSQVMVKRAEWGDQAWALWDLRHPTHLPRDHQTDPHLA